MKPEFFKPFNIEHAKAGAPYSRLDGLEATILKWDGRDLGNSEGTEAQAMQDAVIELFDGEVENSPEAFNKVVDLAMSKVMK